MVKVIKQDKAVAPELVSGYDCSLPSLEDRVSAKPSEQLKRIELLAHVFPSLAKDATQDLDSLCLEIHYEAGELIAQEESYVSGLYIIQAGLVKTGKYGAAGAGKRVLRLLGVGELFGLEAVALARETHLQYAKALIKTSVVFIERNNLLAFRNQHRELCVDFTRWLARDVVMLEFKLTRDAVDTVDGNLAIYLIALAHKYGRPEEKGAILDLPVPRRTMAEMLGVSIETLMRALRRFRDRGLIETSGRRITIINLEQLEERARTTPYYLSVIEDTH